MTKQDKIALAQNCITKAWACPTDSFTKDENLIMETNQAFFEVATFGHNAVIRADKSIHDWCVSTFADVPANLIMDGENLYLIEQKLRENGHRLSGEHVNYMHLYPSQKAETPQGFSFEVYEQDRMSELYADAGFSVEIDTMHVVHQFHTKSPRFESALNYDEKGEVLAIVARKDDDIAAVVAADDYNYGLWQIGIDTVPRYRGMGLAAYLVKEIAYESEKRGETVFYATWGANIASTRTALKAGFAPVWVSFCAEKTE